MENMDLSRLLLQPLTHAPSSSPFLTTVISQLLVKSVLCVCVLWLDKCHSQLSQMVDFDHIFISYISCFSCSYWLYCFICLLSSFMFLSLSHSQNLHQQCRSPLDTFVNIRESIHFFMESFLLEVCILLPPLGLVLRLLQSWHLPPSFHLAPMLAPVFIDPKSSLAWLCPHFSGMYPLITA